MTYLEFLARVIDDGIEAVKKDYADPEQEPKLRGSIEGFEACRGKSCIELSAILAQAMKSSQQAMVRVHESEISDREYWALRCRTAEIQWTCNVVSAMLINQKINPIIVPTARGALKAAEILGVEGK